jgi:hypothetical protein
MQTERLKRYPKSIPKLMSVRKLGIRERVDDEVDGWRRAAAVKFGEGGRERI